MPPTSSPSPLKLIFTTTSLHNVTIATESDSYYYEVVTHKWDPLVTKVQRLDPHTDQMALVAEMRRDQSSSRYTGLRLIDSEKEEAELIPLGKFLLDGDDEKSLGTFFTKDGKSYKWQKSKQSAELIRADEPEGKVLARFHKHHRYLGVLRMSENPFLEVDTELAPSMDALIVSFLLAERRRRG